MGRAARPKSLLLPTKLLRIRLALGLSQNELIEHLGYREELAREKISKYERGTLEPPLPILLCYARLANLCTDVLIDDELDLPAQIPSPQRHAGIPRKKPKPPRSPQS